MITREGAIAAFLEQHPDAEWGPCHWILSDYNDDDGNLADGIAAIDEELARGEPEADSYASRKIASAAVAGRLRDQMVADWYEEQLATRALLESLFALPIREWPETRE